MASKQGLTKRTVLARVGTLAVASPFLSSLARAEHDGELQIDQQFDCSQFSFSQRGGVVDYQCNDQYRRRRFGRRLPRVGRRRVSNIRIRGDDFEVDFDRRGDLRLQGDGDIDINADEYGMDIHVGDARIDLDEDGLRYDSSTVHFEHADEFEFSLKTGATGQWAFEDDGRDEVEFVYEEGTCRIEYDADRRDVDLRIMGC